MKKLSKSDQKTYDTLITRMEAVSTKLDRAIEEWNELTETAREFTQDVIGQMSDYLDARSDAWREGDKCAAFETWMAEWENIELDEVDISAGNVFDQFSELNTELDLLH